MAGRSGGTAGPGDAAAGPRPGPAIATLTLSPALDCTLRVPGLELGRSHRAAPAAEVLGGKGVNVARVLRALGVDVAALGPVAREHWPAEAREPATAPDAVEAEAADVSTDAGEPTLSWEFTDTSAPLRRSYAVVEDSGRATVVNEASHPHLGQVWTQLRDTVEGHLADSALTVLVISGSTPEDCPDDLLPGLIAAAHAADVEVIVDTSAQGLLTAARAGADWVKPNAEELRALFPAAGPDGAGLSDGSAFADDAAGQDAVITAAGRLIDAGAGHVLLSLGAEGMVLLDATGPQLRARLDHPLRGNPTGAGDAAVAALAWGLAESHATRQSDKGPGTARADRRDRRGHRLGVRADRLGARADRDVAHILTRAVAVSASAVLMPQAGQVHPSWTDLRSRVVLEDLLTDHLRTGAQP